MPRTITHPHITAEASLQCLRSLWEPAPVPGTWQLPAKGVSRRFQPRCATLACAPKVLCLRTSAADRRARFATPIAASRAVLAPAGEWAISGVRRGARSGRDARRAHVEPGRHGPGLARHGARARLRARALACVRHAAASPYARAAAAPLRRPVRCMTPAPALLPQVVAPAARRADKGTHEEAEVHGEAPSAHNDTPARARAPAQSRGRKRQNVKVCQVRAARTGCVLAAPRRRGADLEACVVHCSAADAQHRLALGSRLRRGAGRRQAAPLQPALQVRVALRALPPALSARA